MKDMIVLSYYGFSVPVGGLSVCLTRYPDRRTEHVYFPPYPYFQVANSWDLLYRDSAVIVERILQFLIRRPSRILFPDDAYGHSVLERLPNLEIERGKVYGWVVRYARTQFAEELSRIGLPSRPTKGGLLPPTFPRILEWIREDPVRAVLHGKHNSLKWRSLWREATGEEWERYVEKLASGTRETIRA